MTEENIMLMAQKAGPLTQGPFEEWCKRFAALVAAHEREACAKSVENIARKYQKAHEASAENIADERAAIKLANELDLCAAVRVFNKQDIEQASAELRRLHKVNQELLEALKNIANTPWEK